MANHCHNSLTVEGQLDKVKEIFELVTTEDSDAIYEPKIKFTMNKMIPMPKELEEATGGTVIGDYLLGRIPYRDYTQAIPETGVMMFKEYKDASVVPIENILFLKKPFIDKVRTLTPITITKDLTDFIESHSEEEIKQEFPDDEEFLKEFNRLSKDIYGARLRSYNKEKYGYEGWFDFCLENWGTNRNAMETYDVDVDFKDGEERGCFSLSFDTAWSPADLFIKELCKRYPDVTIYGCYNEPGANLGADFYNDNGVYYEDQWDDEKLKKANGYEDENVSQEINPPED